MKLIPRHITNQAALQGWYDKKEAMEADKNVILNRNHLGDSITSGAFCGLANIVNYLNKSFVARCRNHDNAKYQNCGSGFMTPMWHDPTSFMYMNFSSGWLKSGLDSGTYWGGVWVSYITYTPGASVNFEFVGTGIRLFYVQGLINFPSGGKAAGTFTTEIDGGEAVSHSTAGTANNYKYIDITGLENTRHSIKITFTGTSDQAFNFFGAMELTDATYGIRTSNLGRVGSAAGWYLNNNTICNNLANVHKADLAIVAVGVNDYLSSTTLTNYETNMERLINALKTAGSDILIMIEAEPTPIHTPNWDSFSDIQYSLADEHDLAVLDINKRFNGRTGLIASSDGVHYTTKGHRDVAQALLNVI